MGDPGMERAAGLTLKLVPHPLDSGAPEERATFGALEVRVNGRCLTEGVALHGSDELLPGPYVSGYHLAEWLMWNWWRLLWESPPANESSREWMFSHCLSSIGEGYVWPNIVISSDGFRAIAASSPTVDVAPGLYRYVGAPAIEVVAAEDLEAGIRCFAHSVLERLRDGKLADTNLHRLWRDVEQAGEDAQTARLRRFEARLGQDPDEVEAAVIRASFKAAESLGANALEELAADSGPQGAAKVPTMKMMAASAQQNGFDAQPQDAAELHQRDGIPAWGEVAAWRVGVAAARALRAQEALNGEAIDNKRLSKLAGTTQTALEQENRCSQRMSFMLTDGGRSRLALRSRWETGRRFDLARLLGDQLLAAGEPLLPATGAYTYRQKAQRAFAAELLCPYKAVVEFLGTDRSEERCREAAAHFEVSSWTIGALLVNNEGQRQGALSVHSPPNPSASLSMW